MATVPELLELFRAALGEQLRDDGWTELDDPALAVEIAHPLGEEFIAVAEVDRVTVVPDRPPVLIMDVDAAVSYLPLRRLWPLLGERRLEPRVVRPLREPADDENDLQAWPIASAAAAGTVAARVAALVRSQTLEFASEHADVETMLAWFDETDGPGHYRGLALLAAAGRFDEARARLDSFDPADGFPDRPDDAGGRRFARQLRRWIDSGGDPRLRTDSPPPPRTDFGVESISTMWSKATDEHRAVQAVQRVAAGRSRDELRALLEAELAKRDMSKSPIWIEQTLDTLSLSQTEQWQRVGSILGQLGAGLARTVRDGKLPDLSIPEWLAPPARAAYAVPRNRERQRAAVLLDPDAGDWLDEIYDALPKVLDNPIDFDAWLEPDAAAGEVLAVHVGQRRVGLLDEPATASFAPVMRAAAERDELPYTAAGIRRLADGRYVLEVQLPKPVPAGETRPTGSP